MQALREELKLFYNNQDAYRENLKKLRIDWYENCLMLFLKHFSNKDACVLDIGCGLGTTTQYLGNEYKTVIGIDYSLKFCKHSKELVKPGNSSVYVNSDACFLPIKNECVDAILAYAMIEHLYDVGKALEEMHRVLKKDGIILIHMPNLLSPLRPIKAIFSRERLRYPKPESGSNLFHSIYLIFRDIFLILRKYTSRKARFIYRNPNFEIMEGDYDAVYLSSPVDIKKYFKSKNYEVNDFTYPYRPYQGRSCIKKGLKWGLHKIRILQMIKMPPGTYATLLMRKG